MQVNQMNSKVGEKQYIYEFFEKVSQIEDRGERIKFLKENCFKQAKSILQLQWNDKIVLDLPKGKPPFTACPEGQEPVPLARAFSNLRYCVVGNKTPRIKKEKIFIDILESVCEEDAKILCAAKDGNLLSTSAKKYSKMTLPLVKEALPEIL
jgi:hypothetical protein